MLITSANMISCISHLQSRDTLLFLLWCYQWFLKTKCHLNKCHTRQVTLEENAIFTHFNVNFCTSKEATNLIYKERYVRIFPSDAGKGITYAPGVVNRDAESNSTAIVNIPWHKNQNEGNDLESSIKSKVAPLRPHASHGTQICLLCVVRFSP